MSELNPPDNPQEGPHSATPDDGWPWPQIALLSFNVGFLMVASGDLLVLIGMGFPEAVESLSGLLVFVGLITFAGFFFSRSTRQSVGAEFSFSPQLRNWNFGLFGTSVLMMLLSLIIPAFHAAQSAADQERAKAGEMDPDTWHTVRSEKSLFVVDIPSHWVDVTDQDADVAHFDRANDLGFTMTSFPKEDVTFDSLGAWADEGLPALRESSGESKVIERVHYAAPGPPAIEILFEYTSGNTRLIHLVRYIDMPNHYVIVQAMGPRSDFRAHEETLRRMVRSVKTMQSAPVTKDVQRVTEAETKPDVWQTVRSEKSLFVVDIPPPWVESTDPALQSHDVCREHPVNDMVFLMMSFSKEDVSFDSFDAWVEGAFKYLRETFAESKVIERVHYAAPGPPAIEILLEHTDENTRWVRLVRFIDMPNHYVIVQAMGPRSDFRAHEETLRRMVHSVRSE